MNAYREGGARRSRKGAVKLDALKQDVECVPVWVGKGSTDGTEAGLCWGVVF